jgi:hypothetical protein
VTVAANNPVATHATSTRSVACGCGTSVFTTMFRARLNLYCERRMVVKIGVSRTSSVKPRMDGRQTMTTRKRRPGPILIAAALLTAALPITAATGSSAQGSPSPRSLPTWAHGSITGAGPHNGVRLVLVAWPKAKIRVGQKVHLRVVGRTTSSSSGSYAIHPSIALPKGIHNLEVLARSSSAVGAFGFARKVAPGGRALVPADGSASTRPVTANIHMMALPKSEQSAARDPSFACSPIVTKTREFGPRSVTVGGLYSFVSDAKMKMTYTAGSTTTMGVGISIPGDFGSFSAGGTFTETSSGKEGFPTEQGQADVNMQTQYTYGEYHVCFMSQVQPEVWVTGDREVNVQPPVTDPPDKCGHYHNNGFLTRTTGTAGTFKAGVNLKGVIGINLSAQSGYTKNVSITWTFPSGGYLCGTNGYPSVAAFNVMNQTKFGNPAPHKKQPPK